MNKNESTLSLIELKLTYLKTNVLYFLPGKTATIVALLRALVQSKKTVLVVSYTGTALENILVRYKTHGEDFVKISTSGRTDQKFSGRTTKDISRTATRIDLLKEAYNKVSNPRR